MLQYNKKKHQLQDLGWMLYTLIIGSLLSWGVFSTIGLGRLRYSWLQKHAQWREEFSLSAAATEQNGPDQQS